MDYKHFLKRENYSIYLVLAVILTVAGFFAYLQKNGNPSVAQLPADNGTTTVVNITSKNFEFSVKEIRVKLGERIKIILTNEQGLHDFVIDEFNVKTPKINGKGSQAVIFEADKAGTFEFYCSIGTHRQMGMRGNLIVDP
jgi:plastocyanin